MSRLDGRRPRHKLVVRMLGTVMDVMSMTAVRIVVVMRMHFHFIMFVRMNLPTPNTTN